MVKFLKNEKIGSKEWITSYSLLTVGSFLLAVAIVLFISPYKLAPGGTSGIAIVLHNLLGWKLSYIQISLDIPLLVLGFVVLGPKFGVKTVVSTLQLTFFIYMLETHWWGSNRALVEGDALLSTIFGGVITGVACGLIFKSKATSGGMDIIAMIVHKYTRLSLGKSIVLLDVIIVTTTFVAFHDWKLPLYSLISIYILGRVIDLVLEEGTQTHKTCLIITDNYKDIRSFILDDLDRSGTLIKGKGLYEGQERNIIYTILTRREFALIRANLHKIDPNAFLNVIDSNEPIGFGFRPLVEED